MQIKILLLFSVLVISNVSIGMHLQNISGEYRKYIRIQSITEPFNGIIEVNDSPNENHWEVDCNLLYNAVEEKFKRKVIIYSDKLYTIPIEKDQGRLDLNNYEDTGLFFCEKPKKIKTVIENNKNNIL